MNTDLHRAMASLNARCMPIIISAGISSTAINASSMYKRHRAGPAHRPWYLDAVRMKAVRPVGVRRRFAAAVTANNRGQLTIALWPGDASDAAAYVKRQRSAYLRRSGHADARPGDKTSAIKLKRHLFGGNNFDTTYSCAGTTFYVADGIFLK